MKRNTKNMGQKQREYIVTLVTTALLAAMFIVLDKFLIIPIGNSIRLSFGLVPLILSGVFFGPVFGGLTGAAGDIIGCIISGMMPINPIIVAGNVIIGVIAGFFDPKWVCGGKYYRYFILSMASSLPSAAVIKTIGLYLYYRTPPITVVWRIISVFLLAVLSAPILKILTTRKEFLKFMPKRRENKIQGAETTKV